MITINIASIPQRQKFLQQTLKSIFANEKRPDRINIYLNNYPEVPKFLSHENIVIYESEKETGDLSDKGKFYKVERAEGYYFTCDDDIIYPRDYIGYLIDKIEENKRLCICGFHGTIFRKNPKSFYFGNEIFYFFNGLGKDTRVHMLGTGTTAWHNETIKLKLEHFESNMADLYLMIQSQEQQVPMICLMRKDGYLKEQDGSQIAESIWKQNRDTEHINILKKQKLYLL